MPAVLEEPSLILIIDDSVDSIRLLNGMLNGMGQILFATSGAAGIALARQRRPQLILLDVEMSGMDGYQVCRALRADPDTRECAIIFVTARTSMESEVAGLEAGAVDFITKPLNPPVARARVRIHLKLQRNAALQAQLANQDGLTGLFNRRYFDAQMARECLRHARQGQPLGLAFIDVDCFKAYNDHYGHQDGDDCLKTVAGLIGAGLRRPGQICARYGGEEFVVILPDTGAAEAQRYGAHLCRQVAGLNLPHAASTVAAHLTVSVGVASMVPEGSDSERRLIAAADGALYRAKSGGRNRSEAAPQG